MAKSEKAVVGNSTKPIDISGRRFGRLIAIKLLSSRTKHKQRVWRCVCDCRVTSDVVQRNLTTGNTKSCGCGRRKHGAYRTRIYSIWRGMVNRCHNPNNQAFRLYGARGIKVCRRWRQFKNFFVDMGAPEKGMSIERINNDKGYSKNNCKWATRLEQGGNRRDNRLLTYKGRTLHMNGWARLIGVKVSTIRSKLRRDLPLSQVLQTSR